MASPVFPAYFAIFNFSTSTKEPFAAEDKEAVPKRTSLPRFVIGRAAVPVLLLLVSAVRTSVVPEAGLELEGRAKPVTGRPDCDTGRTEGS